MKTFKNVLILIGALFIPLATLVVCFSWAHAEGRAAPGGQALLLLLAVVFAFKRNFVATGLYLAGILFIMLVYLAIWVR